MRLKLNSSLLHCTQPDGYWVFGEFLNGLEARESEYRQERADEVVEIPDEGQPWLLGMPRKLCPGKNARRAVRRRDLPQNHPEYQGYERCELDSEKALDILARCWVDTLQRWIDERGVSMKVTFADRWSPKEYNFRGDQAGFFLSVSKLTLFNIVDKCLVEYREMFEEYLGIFHSSRDGYISWVSTNVADYDRYRRMVQEDIRVLLDSDGRTGKPEHLVWVCLDFWLFGIEGGENDDVSVRFEGNTNRFEELLWYAVEDADDNGAFYEVMTYRLAEEEAVV